MSIIKDKNSGRFVKNLKDKGCLQCSKVFHPRFSTIKFCSKKCEGKFRTKDHNRPCVHCGKSFYASAMKTRFCSNQCYGNSGAGARIGKLNNNWKGGITPLSKKIRNSTKYTKWSKLVKERDGFICVFCKSNKDIETDHIIPFAAIIEKIRFQFGIKNIFENAMKCELLWDMTNARTLCIDCHVKTDTYLNKMNKNYVI